MKRNYLLVYSNIYGGVPQYRYFESKEDMKDFIKNDLSQKSMNNKKYWKVLHKYEIKEVK